MSTYPSTATLAAFRRAVVGDLKAYARATRAALGYGIMPPALDHPAAGAFPDELREGIGVGPEPWDGAEDRWGSNVRSEASALRSRAYRAIADSAWAYDPDWEDFGRYRETFCPEHTARMMRQVRIVARALGVL